MACNFVNALDNNNNNNCYAAELIVTSQRRPKPSTVLSAPVHGGMARLSKRQDVQVCLSASQLLLFTVLSSSKCTRSNGENKFVMKLVYTISDVLKFFNNSAKMYLKINKQCVNLKTLQQL